MTDRAPDGLRLAITTREPEPRAQVTMVPMVELTQCYLDPLPTRLGFMAACLGGELADPPPDRWTRPEHDSAFEMHNVGLLNRDEALICLVTVTARWWWRSEPDDED